MFHINNLAYPPSRVRERTLAESSQMSVVYLPWLGDQNESDPRCRYTYQWTSCLKARLPKDQVEVMILPEAGDLILDGAGNLWQFNSLSPPKLIIGQPDQLIHVVNLGQWDAINKSFSGLEASFVGDRWEIDINVTPLMNTSSIFNDWTETDPLPGFWISPGNATYEIIRMYDETGPFVRIRAIQDSPYLVVTGNEPLGTLDEVPITLVAQIRARSQGKQSVSLVDYTSSEDNQWHKNETIATEQWETLTIDGKFISWPSQQDTYSVGLIEVEAGDWFDVRELSLYIGRLP